MCECILLYQFLVYLHNVYTCASSFCTSSWTWALWLRWAPSWSSLSAPWTCSSSRCGRCRSPPPSTSSSTGLTRCTHVCMYICMYQVPLSRYFKWPIIPAKFIVCSFLEVVCMYVCMYAPQGVCSADSAARSPAEQRRGILWGFVCVCADRLLSLAGCSSQSWVDTVLYMYVCMYVDKYLGMNHIYAWLNICMFWWMDESMYVCMYVCI